VPYPQYKDIEKSLLQYIYQNEGNVRAADCYRPVGALFGLSELELTQSLDEAQGQGGARSKWENMVQWTRNNLAKTGLVERPAPNERGNWKLTEKGTRLAENIAKYGNAEWVFNSTNKEGPADSGWRDDELSATVEAYLEMLRYERDGKPFKKKSYYHALAKKFGRTAKAFEYRMQNISYVLSLLGRTWVTGLRPAKNVGTKVAADIEALIAQVENKKVVPIVAFEIAIRESLGKKQKIPNGNQKPETSSSEVTFVKRDAAVKAWVLRHSNGLCDCCKRPSPFSGVDGMPYLEVHHVRQLADKGSDTISNTVALCPNCHREIHYGVNAANLVHRLYEQVTRLVRE
jgi:5-methylcytosine-specific restriction protein A